MVVPQEHIAEHYLIQRSEDFLVTLTELTPKSFLNFALDPLHFAFSIVQFHLLCFFSFSEALRCLCLVLYFCEVVFHNHSAS